MNDLLDQAKFHASQASREENDPWLSGLPAIVLLVVLWVAFFWIVL